MNSVELVKIRKYLHRNPELSNQEWETQGFIINQLSKLKHNGLQEVGNTGVMILFEGKQAGKNILIRADTDALAIQEINDFEHKSIKKGVSHKCGHDGHTTILLGLAAQLSKSKPEKGDVCLIFQPAEENGTGAKAILDDGKFNFKADMAFALHNLPGYPLHHVICRKEGFSAAAKSVIFKLYGKTAHAAEPEMGINPSLAIAEILQCSEDLSHNDTSTSDFRLITPVYVHMGEKSYGVSAGYGEVHLTLRTWKNEVMDKLDSDLVSAVESICKKHKLKLDKEYLEIFHSNYNDTEAYEIIKQAANDNKLEFEERKSPFKWAEDFGLLTKKFKGAMFGIGSGLNTPALHNPDYDFPDEIIETGIKMFSRIIEIHNS